jgi:hypothetical protein
MHSCRSARFQLLVAFFLLSSLLAGCQGQKPIAASAIKGAGVIKNTATPIPTRTLAVLPPLPTSTPTIPVVEVTRTPSPTPTATLNLPQTMIAKATNDKSAKCKKYEDAWEITITPYWQPGWCQIKSIGGFFYEYGLIYPDQWKVATFGDVFPNMAFNTGKTGTELRLYQVYKYGTRTYTGTLEDAPLKASFCDTDDNCTLVVSPTEKITNRESRSVGGREVYVVDSQDGKYNVRRYFFYVPFKYASPKSNRLFFFKLYTPDPVSSSNYRDIEGQIEDMITSIKHQL